MPIKKSTVKPAASRPLVDANGYTPIDVLEPAERRKLNRLCLDKRAVREQINLLEKDDKALGVEIAAFAESHQLEKVRADGWQLLRVSRTVRTLSPEKLLAMGVSMSVIEQAYDEKTSVSYQVRGTEVGK